MPHPKSPDGNYEEPQIGPTSPSGVSFKQTEKYIKYDDLPQLTILPEWSVTSDTIKLHVYDGDQCIESLVLDISNTKFAGGPTNELGSLLKALKHNIPNKFKS